MKKIYQLGLSSLIFASISAFAANPVQGPYVGFMVGGNYISNVDLTIARPNAEGSRLSELTYKMFINGGGMLGYRWERVRLEGELNYANNPYKSLKFGTLAIRSMRKSPGLRLAGGTSIISGLVNAYYDLCIENSDLEPYVGLGIGYARIQNNVRLYFNNNYVIDTRAKASQSSAVGQGIVGINYFLDDFTTVGLDYRYLATRKIAAYNNQSLNVSTVNIVMNFAFDSGT